jgi:ectoine hydroxylase-related dioxygenase (phytanoyl-CoA dioxygenase family)
MTTALSDSAERVDFSHQIRDLTPQEIETFHRDGFVDVQDFIAPELVAEVKQHYMAWSGIRWDEWPDDPADQQAFVEAIERPREKWLFAIRQEDPWIFNYVTQAKFGKAAAELIGTSAVRMLSETLHVKYPESSGHSRILEWHQDYPFLPIDRARAVQLWVALAPITKDMGPMVHLKGSHREPPLGMFSVSKQRPQDEYPELWERYELTEPHDLQPGDAVFHSSLCFHASGLNHTDRVRWGMSSYRIAADCLFTGQPNHNTDGLGLEPMKPLDHPNFPIIYER